LEYGFPLIRSLRASAQRSTLVLFSFELSLLIVAGSLAIGQSKTILGAIYEAVPQTTEWQPVGPRLSLRRFAFLSFLRNFS
jgi:hypothetical protein